MHVHRQESYISRERAYKMRIDELEEELNNQRQAKTGWMKTDPKAHKFITHIHTIRVREKIFYFLICELM